VCDEPANYVDMDIVVLFGILALFLFGPRRGGRMPSRIAMIGGALILLWFLAAFGMGAIWKAIFGTLPQP
jgi:hypothetical protein